MAQNRAEQRSWVDRIRVELTRDLKKTIILGTLALVLVALTLREVLRRSSPASASAAVAVAGTPSQASHPGQAPRASARGRTRDTNEIALPTSGPAEFPQTVVDRDLFTPEVAYFPPKAKPKPAPVVRRVDDGVARREAQERAIRTQARALSLQSTVSGDAPTAMINGEVLHVGDEIAGFRVVKITTRSCTVRKENLLILLEMAGN